MERNPLLDFEGDGINELQPMLRKAVEDYHISIGYPIPESANKLKFPVPKEPIALERMFVAECDEYGNAFVDSAIGNIEYVARILSAEEAAQWVRENTDLVETEPGKFLISEKGTGMMGEEIPARYLVID